MVWVPKSRQKSSQIGPLALSSALGRPSAAFGTTLGGILGPWGSKKSPMGILRAPFGRPVGSFGRLGGPFWLPLGCFGRLLSSFLEARGLIWGPRRRKRRLFGIMRFPWVKPHISWVWVGKCRPEWEQDRGSGGLLGVLGGLLVAFGASLATSGSSWAALRQFLAALWASWGDFGPILSAW